jgi:hypothetical protein
MKICFKNDAALPNVSREDGLGKYCYAIKDRLHWLVDDAT